MMATAMMDKRLAKKHMMMDKLMMMGKHMMMERMAKTGHTVKIRDLEETRLGGLIKELA